MSFHDLPLATRANGFGGLDTELAFNNPNVVRHVGATPVFADVAASTGNVTAETLAPRLTPRTRAIIAVDQGGVPVDLAPIRELADARGIVVIEDAACGAGATYRGRPVGAGADLTAWSFHPRKVLTTGEGGMLTTGNEEWAVRARRLREHAMSVSAADRHRATIAPAEEYVEVGHNFRMTDLQAAMGVVQLEKLPAIVARRREIAAEYQREIAGIPGLRAVADPTWGESSFQSFWVEIDDAYPVDRDGLLAALAAADISARRGIMAAHRQAPYRDLATDGELPVTTHLTDRTLILPLFHAMTADDVRRVLDVLRDPTGVPIGSDGE